MAADTDTVWSCFVPRELPRFAKREISPAPASKKALFKRLSCLPAFLPRKLMHMRLDKATGAKCFMLSAEILQITKHQGYVWDWTPLGFDRNACHIGKRQFQHVATFRNCGKIHCKMLSQKVMYAAYMVFKLGPTSFYGIDYPFQEASISVGGRGSTSIVCLQSCMEDEGDGGESPRIHVLESPDRAHRVVRCPRVITLGEDMVLPRKRADDWMEVELGEFYNEEGYDEDVSVSLTETTVTKKYGLIVMGVEFRNRLQKPTGL
ncbi:hypothetical protein VPH35_106928 [Triticum aestivum]